MNNREVAHAFIRGEAGAEGSHFRTAQGKDGAVILMSYSTPVGYRTGHGMVVLDKRSFSVSTARNVGMVKNAKPDYIGLDHEEFVKRATIAGADFSLARG